MSTVRDLVRDSLLTIGAIGSGENIPADAMADAIRSLNRMLGSWSVDGFLIYQYVREVFQLTAGKADYTIGLEGDFDTTRPVQISEASSSDANVIVTELTPFIPGDPMADPPTEDIPATYSTEIRSVIETPVRILTLTEWAQIPDKRIQSQYVSCLYQHGTNPLEKISVYPVPSVASALVLYTQKALLSSSSPNTVLNLPPGYEEALMYGLAGRLCPQYGKQMTPEVAAVANEAVANIKRQNTKPLLMKSDISTCPGIYNIYTGGYE